MPLAVVVVVEAVVEVEAARSLLVAVVVHTATTCRAPLLPSPPAAPNLVQHSVPGFLKPSRAPPPEQA